MAEPAEYGDITVTVHAPTVDHAPDRALITLELLTNLNPQLWIRGSRIYVGHTTDGKPVHYQVVGWEPAQHALIVEREPEP